MANPKPPKPDPLAWVDLGQLVGLIDDPPDSAWRLLAACRGTEVDMFPDGIKGVPAAKAVCALCPVVYECLAWVLVTNPAGMDFGVAGNLSVRERRQMRRRITSHRQATAGTA